MRAHFINEKIIKVKRYRRRECVDFFHPLGVINQFAATSRMNADNSRPACSLDALHKKTYGKNRGRKGGGGKEKEVHQKKKSARSQCLQQRTMEPFL